MDLVQLVQQEEDQSASVGGGTVLLRSLRDLGRDNHGDGYLLSGLDRDLLGVFKGLNQSDVIKNVTLLLGELLEQRSLQVVELDLVAVKVLDESFLLGSEIRSLLLDNEGKDLVLETRLCDRKVDQGTLGLNLGWVVRALQLGVQVQGEVRVKPKLLVSHLNVLVLTTLDNGTSVDGLNDGVDVVLKVLNHDGVSSFDAGFKSLDDLGVRQTGDIEIVSLLTLLEPGDALELRIDDERVSVRVGENSAILGGHSIRRQLLVVP